MQVCLQGTTCGTRITLQDAEGIFLDLEPGERERDLPNEGHNEVTWSKGEDLESLWKTVKEVSEE